MTLHFSAEIRCAFGGNLPLLAAEAPAVLCRLYLWLRRRAPPAVGRAPRRRPVAGVARGAVMLQVGGAAPAGTRVPQCLERPAAILRKSGSDRKLLPPALELFVILSAAVPS